MNYIEKYNEWINSNIIDNDIKQELINIKNNTEEIEERFYKDLEFGTAGLRGIIGAGTNRMNKYTVEKATQGLANYIIKNNGQNNGVAIAYDSRHMSKEFGEITALCLNANGIKTYLFESLRTVPELSFAVRCLKAKAGVMITASHNPPEYNGYKVYWEDGAQIVSPVDTGIMDEVNKIEDFSLIKTIDKKEAIKLGLFNVIGQEIDDKYIEELKKLVLNKKAILDMKEDLKIVYTPLHGAGNQMVQRILNELGFEKVYIVKEQELPDGDFPTVSYPNPEDANAFKLALDLAKEKDADIVLANDPDADRLGIYAKDSKTGQYISFTGNMSGLLIAEYELSQRKLQNKLADNSILIKTIVSSNLAYPIAKKYNLQVKEVLTGFKYIGEQIKKYEQNGKYKFEFGFEESYGCLIGTHARDKDGIAAVMALCEAAAFYKKQGLTLWDQMLNIYKEYGFYKEETISITKKGVDGSNQIQQIMEDLRNNPPTKLGKYSILKIRDYKNQDIDDLPKSNVLYFEMTDGAWCAIRPSGTEPKIKFYIGVKESSIEEANIQIKNLKENILKIIN